MRMERKRLEWNTFGFRYKYQTSVCLRCFGALPTLICVKGKRLLEFFSHGLIRTKPGFGTGQRSAIW